MGLEHEPADTIYRTERIALPVETRCLERLFQVVALVEVHGADGGQWRSSLTRDDTGAGACELVWVEELDVR